MVITWYGQSSFRLQSSKINILIDPYSPRKVGLRGPNFSSDILILTEPDAVASCEKKLKKGCFLIKEPGEYEVRNIFVYGIHFQDKVVRTIYQITIDNIRFGVLGEIDKGLAAEQLEWLNGVDVLFIPVGAKCVLSSTKARELINQIEPRVVIPSCYKISGMKANLDSKTKFLKEMGVESLTLDKLTLKKQDLLGEETKIIVLRPKS